MLILPIAVALIGVIIATITDIKTREVPDLVSYGMIAIGLGLGAITSAILWSWIPLIQSAVGYGLGYGIGVAMFYTGQWGGGDSKVVMGLGAIFGASLWDLSNFSFITFIVNSLLVGAVYGIAWSAALGIKHRKAFLARLRQISVKKPVLTYRWIMIAFAMAGIIASAIVALTGPAVLAVFIFGFTAIIFVLFYMGLFIKIVEQTCLIKAVDPQALTEGDWIAKDIYVGKKYIAGPKDLGISLEQIALLRKLRKQGKIKKVVMKEGIPFVPSFLIALVLTIWLGNWLLLLIF